MKTQIITFTHKKRSNYTEGEGKVKIPFSCVFYNSSATPSPRGNYWGHSRLVCFIFPGFSMQCLCLCMCVAFCIWVQLDQTMLYFATHRIHFWGNKYTITHYIEDFIFYACTFFLLSSHLEGISPRAKDVLTTTSLLWFKHIT